MDLAESIFLAAALHAGLLFASARSMPAIGGTEDVADHGDQQGSYGLLGEPFPAVGPDEVDDAPPATTPAERDPDGREPSRSRCGVDRAGRMGEPSAADQAVRYGVQGPADNPDPHLARFPAPQEARTFPLIGLRPEDPWGGNPASPTMPWGRDDDLGNDPESARGHMWGEVLGAALGLPEAGFGFRRHCPTCGDDGRGAEASREGATAEGGATGTERALAR